MNPRKTFINADTTFSARELKDVDATVYYGATLVGTGDAVSLDKALKKYPDADVTARVIFAVVGDAFFRKIAWRDITSVALHKSLRIGDATYIFPRDVLDAFQALAATGDLEAVTRYASLTVAASQSVDVFRWTK